MDLNGVLLRAVELGSTDVHLKYGQPPVCRIDGDLTPMADARPLDESALISVLETIGRRAPEKLQHFHDAGDMDIAYQDGDLPRFRVNAYRQRGAISFAFRVIPKTVPTFEQLNLPPGVQKLANEHRGLILVTGATGSGKTTTLAAMIDYMNRNRKQHIITIEDPIEILHPDRGCIVNQREVGLDTESFGQALRRALRQDPDTILIGELRDAETAQTALQAAESGHLVLSTLHTIDAAETVGRMIEFFPPEKQEVIRSIMAGVMRGVISQRLLPKVDGGRVAAVEVMVMNARIADLVREGRSDEITDAVAEGEYFQMQTFSQALIDHVLDGRVDSEVAANAATNRHDFLVELEQAMKRKRAAEARPAEQPQQHVAEPEAVPAPTLATVEPDEGLGLRIVPAG
ncbi:MAG TPA: PilT/PilU family type 4a pilus ATPase [Gaiellaceae bacterium]|jgi:twitching motility protein PilT|nr:PilT/PilU family type 4a pilus ATPase [Gaiellaceae bacterium]